MRLLNNEELFYVSGGDAAATRPPGTNSYGETPDQEEERKNSQSIWSRARTWIQNRVDEALDLWEIDGQFDSNGNPRS